MTFGTFHSFEGINTTFKCVHTFISWSQTSDFPRNTNFDTNLNTIKIYIQVTERGRSKASWSREHKMKMKGDTLKLKN